MDTTSSQQLAQAVLAAATKRGLKIATAESLTGGMITAALSAVPGSSSVLLGGVVAYQNQVKEHALGVPAELLQQLGAVDSAVAVAMAQGVRARFARDCGITDELVVGLATTGVAGPDAIDGKPVGEVFIALDASGLQVVRHLQLSGSRQQIRQQTVDQILQIFLEQFPA